MLWADRNTVLHEHKIRSGKSTAEAIIAYLKELDEMEVRKLTSMGQKARWNPPSGAIVKANFDGSFDTRQSRACSGVVVRDCTGSVLVSCTVLHRDVASPFAAEAMACFSA